MRQTLIFVFMCQFVSDIDPCEPNPCHNGGLCLPEDDGTFTCQCADGFSGETCETGVCDLIFVIYQRVACTNNGEIGVYVT